MSTAPTARDRHRTRGGNPLPSPAVYFPAANGRYETGPGLRRLGTDFGNGRADGHVFQLDGQWERYRRAKDAARRENRDKYVALALDTGDETAVAGFIRDTLLDSHPEWFAWEPAPGGGRFHCHLSGEVLALDRRLSLKGVHGRDHRSPYTGTLDALAGQVQEDMVVVRLSPAGDRVAAVHVCFPNHWAPADKLGRDFAALHAPVPGMEGYRARGGSLLQAVIDKGPYVRFAWGLTPHRRLNHHPEPPPGQDPATWHGRGFDPAHPRLYLRTERQTLSGVPGTRLVLFTIRTYVTDTTRLEADRRRCLVAALASMSPAQRRYKGLAAHWDAMLQWLAASPVPTR